MSIPDPDADRSRMQRMLDVRQRQGYKSTTLLVSLLIIFTIIGGTVLVALNSGGDDDKVVAPRFPQGTGQPTAQPPITELPPGAFGIPSTDQHGRRVETPTNPLGQVLPQTDKASKVPDSEDATEPVAAPQGLMWQRVNGFPLPFSTSDGPTSVSEDGVPTGFSRTPQGAVMAVWQIYQRTGWGTRAQTTALLADCAVITPQSQATADRLLGPERDSIDTLRQQMPLSMSDVPVAVKISNYDADYANIQVAVPLAESRADGAVATTVAFDVLWRGGTWKWVVPNDGVETGSTVSNLIGWSQW